MFFGVRTKYQWLIDISSVPLLGGILLIMLIGLPAVLLSVLAQLIIPPWNNDIGFTKAMLILMPLTHYFMWRYEIRFYVFFVPSWAILLVISTYKAIMLDY